MSIMYAGQIDEGADALYLSCLSCCPQLRRAFDSNKSGSEQKHATKLEDYVRRVASQDAKTLRTGGGFILNSLAKVEAQAFLRELRI